MGAGSAQRKRVEFYEVGAMSEDNHEVSPMSEDSPAGDEVPSKPVPHLKCVAWDPSDCGVEGAREYSGRTVREIAEQHAEWMYRRGDPQEEYNIRVRVTKDGNVREWDVAVDVEMEVSFYAHVSPVVPNTITTEPGVPTVEPAPVRLTSNE